MTRCRECSTETENPFAADWGLIDPSADQAWCCPVCYERVKLKAEGYPKAERPVATAAPTGVEDAPIGPHPDVDSRDGADSMQPGCMETGRVTASTSSTWPECCGASMNPLPSSDGFAAWVCAECSSTRFAGLSSRRLPLWAVNRARAVLNASPESMCIFWCDRGEGHSGQGWYASLVEYPEEGSVFLGHAGPEEIRAAAAELSESLTVEDWRTIDGAVEGQGGRSRCAIHDCEMVERDGFPGVYDCPVQGCGVGDGKCQDCGGRICGQLPMDLLCSDCRDCRRIDDQAEAVSRARADQDPSPLCPVCGDKTGARMHRHPEHVGAWECPDCYAEAKSAVCDVCGEIQAPLILEHQRRTLFGCINAGCGVGRINRPFAAQAFSDAPTAQSHSSRSREHFPGTEPGQRRENEMSNENESLELGDNSVAKVGLEPTTEEKPKRRGRPRGSKSRNRLQETECQGGASRTNGQRPKGGLDPVALEGAELAVAAQVTRALGMVEGAVVALGHINHNDAAALHPDQLVWMVRGLAALKEAESWLAPAVSISLGKPQVNGGTPVRVLCGGGSKEGVVQRTADNWVQVELPDQKWRGWFDLRTGMLLGQLSPFAGVAFSDLFRLDLDSLDGAENSAEG